MRILFLSSIIIAGCGGGNASDATCTTRLSPSADATVNHTAIQTALSNAVAGNVICLHGGNYPLKDEIDLSADRVEILSMSDGSAVLDFNGQAHGANGLSVTGNGDKITGITVKNTPGDAIRVTQATGITFTSVTVTWDGGAQTSNGAYGLYPVQSTNVLIDKCKVSYASDAGIYVGQSKNILVRDSEAFGNVAGIEIENSTDAEVKGNYAHDNTGGILVFNLPNLMMQGGARADVHDNRIVMNNGKNFAAMSSIVHVVPTGTGVLIMAAASNELHHNTIKDNDSVGVAVVSYLITQMNFMDPNYNAYPQGNSVHDNMFSGNGGYPSGLAAVIAAAANVKVVEDMVWDGLVDPMKMNPDGKLTNCFHANGTATFRNLGIDDKGMFHTNTNITPFDCTHDPLPTINL